MFHNLHSTIFILKPSISTALSDIDIFTFYYIYIKTENTETQEELNDIYILLYLY